MHVIRPVRKNDLEPLVRLWNICLPYDLIEAPALERFFASRLYQPEGVLVAEMDGELIGFAIGIADGGVGWIPAFLLRPELVSERVGDSLLEHVLEYFRTHSVAKVQVEPKYDEARFFVGIDRRYSGILEIFERNGFTRTDESQVDIVKNLEGFRIPRRVEDARASLENEGSSFGLCETRLIPRYLEFLTTYFSRYEGWCIKIGRDFQAGGDPRQHVLAFHDGAIVGFCACDKEEDWYIWATGVREDLRLKKIGTVMVYLALEEIGRRGEKRMCVSDCPIEFYKVVDGEILRRYVMLGREL